MKVYMQLPFTNTLCDVDNWYSANLTDDYTAHFEETRRYKFQRCEITKYKYPCFHFSIGNYGWAYTVLDPKTFVLG